MRHCEPSCFRPASHAQAMEDLDDAERRLENAGADDDERELDRLVEVAEDLLDDAEDAWMMRKMSLKIIWMKWIGLRLYSPLMKALSIWLVM